MREKIEAASEKARDIHQSAAAMHAIGMEAGYRLAIEELRERAKVLNRTNPMMRSVAPHQVDVLADYLAARLGEGKHG